MGGLGSSKRCNNNTKLTSLNGYYLTKYSILINLLIYLPVSLSESSPPDVRSMIGVPAPPLRNKRCEAGDISSGLSMFEFPPSFLLFNPTETTTVEPNVASPTSLFIELLHPRFLVRLHHICLCFKIPCSDITLPPGSTPSTHESKLAGKGHHNFGNSSPRTYPCWTPKQMHMRPVFSPIAITLPGNITMAR